MRWVVKFGKRPERGQTEAKHWQCNNKYRRRGLDHGKLRSVGADRLFGFDVGI